MERSYEVIQETGDVIFVPSGWHHQVHNLEDTISINHNWFNGANVGRIFGELKKGISEILTVSQRRRLRESHIEPGTLRELHASSFQP